MADGSAIEWTDATWNPVVGCSLASPGCTNCYAMTMAARIERMGTAPYYAGLTQASKAGPVWTGKVATAPRHVLTQPLRWRKPRRIFVNSMSDLFHDSVSDETIDRVFAVMALCPQHTFQVLTKRAARMREWFEERWQPTPAQRMEFGGDVVVMPANPHGEDRHDQVYSAASDIGTAAGLLDTKNDAHWDEAGSPKALQFAWPLPNVWLGVSAEDQARADERIPELMATPAVKRFVSCEPLLGAINLDSLRESGWHRLDALRGLSIHDQTENTLASIKPIGRLDWVIVGGESGGKSSRPMHPGWVRSLRDQCAGAEVPFFFKQWGDYLPLGPPERWQADVPDKLEWQYLGKKAAGAELDGKTHREFPK